MGAACRPCCLCCRRCCRLIRCCQTHCLYFRLHLSLGFSGHRSLFVFATSPWHCLALSVGRSTHCQHHLRFCYRHHSYALSTKRRFGHCRCLVDRHGHRCFVSFAHTWFCSRTC